MTVQKLIDMLNLIPDKNLLVEVCSWDEAEKYPNTCEKVNELKSKSYSQVDASVNDVLEDVRNYMKFIVNKSRHKYKAMSFESVDKLIDLTIDAFKTKDNGDV